jgi:hypothetical protein
MAKRKQAPAEVKKTAGPGRKECPSCHEIVGARPAECPKCHHKFTAKKKAAKKAAKKESPPVDVETAAEFIAALGGVDEARKAIGTVERIWALKG